jgi:hypothetical protein
MWRGGLRFSLQLPPLSFGGASIAKPSLRFHTLLIKPDMRISRIRLSDKTHTFAHEKSSAVHPTHNTRPCSPEYNGRAFCRQPPMPPHGRTFAFRIINPGPFFASACGACRSSRTLPEFHRVAPISCASLLSAPVLNQGPFPPPALPGFFSSTGLSATP